MARLPSFTINEWCALRRYSRPTFYRMDARGEAPDTIGEGRMRRITSESDAKWLKEQVAKANAKREAKAS
jgi:predicted DNA-binding transcriptional regulator AlpA